MRAKLAFLLFLFCFSLHANNEDSLSAWTQNLLIDTLSATYKDTAADFARVKKNYLPQAWNPMIQFLSDKRALINEQQLTLHPQALTPPQITDSTQCGISPCWQVIQSYAIPELNQRLELVLQIIPGKIARTTQAPFIVQSLSLDIFPLSPQ